MMASEMAKHTPSFLLSLDVFMYFIMFFLSPEFVCLCLYVLCFKRLQDKFPLRDNKVEVSICFYITVCFQRTVKC